jgi:hypothetical protein
MSLRLEYLPLSYLSDRFLEGNPKRHDLAVLIELIERYGFRDPIAIDATADAIVEGNGRVAALIQLQESGTAPRGVVVSEEGEWLVPVVRGGDASSVEEARSYAIDHNNSVMLGGDFTPFDFARLYEEEDYITYLQELTEQGMSPILADDNTLSLLEATLGYKDRGSPGIASAPPTLLTSGIGGAEGEGSSMEDNTHVCPNCGHRFEM